MFRVLYPGRFQPFHLGHLSVVKWSLEKADQIVILIGSSQESHTLSNPFTAGERIEMIKTALEEYGIDSSRYFLIPIPDILMNSVWAYHVKTYVPYFNLVIARNPLVIRLFKEANITVEEPPIFNREKYNSTLIRKMIITGEEWKELVPNSVYTYIKSIKGDERLKEIAGTDKRW